MLIIFIMVYEIIPTHLANGPSQKSLNFIFPTKHVIPKSLKFSHWPSKPIWLALGFLNHQLSLAQFKALDARSSPCQVMVDIQGFSNSLRFGISPLKKWEGHKAPGMYTQIYIYMIAWSVLMYMYICICI